jgi:hypothetical protein
MGMSTVVQMFRRHMCCTEHSEGGRLNQFRCSSCEMRFPTCTKNLIVAQHIAQIHGTESAAARKDISFQACPNTLPLQLWLKQKGYATYEEVYKGGVGDEVCGFLNYASASIDCWLIEILTAKRQRPNNSCLFF